jgi:hypothetical protein
MLRKGKGSVIPMSKHQAPYILSLCIRQKHAVCLSFSCFIPREGAPGIQLTEGWTGPRAGVEVLVSLPGINFWSSRPVSCSMN